MNCPLFHRNLFCNKRTFYNNNCLCAIFTTIKMSQLPSFSNNSYAMRRHRQVNPYSGLRVNLLAPVCVPYYWPRGMQWPPRRYQPQRSIVATGSSIAANRNKFEVNLDVEQFAPHEVTVTVRGNNTIIVEGKHGEKQDLYGFVSRQFVRKYVVPDGFDLNKIGSSLSSDGILNITMPRVNQGLGQQFDVPIQLTGVPVKPAKDAEVSEANANI